MNLGYIGLGRMGSPCVLNLLKAGHSVRVWSRRPMSTAVAVQNGARLCHSIAELAPQVDILFTNVGDTKDVEEVLLGPDGVIQHANPGLLMVDMSTISFTATRRMAQKLEKKGVELVDAPVSGGTTGAKEGTLTFMVGAKPSTFERLKPILLDMGSSVTRVGECGAGQVAKSCSQIMLTATLAALGEAMTFADAAEVDFALVREAIRGGFAGSRVLEEHAQRVLNKDFAPGFKLSLHRKDMLIVEELAKELGLALPVSQRGLALLEKALKENLGDEDSAALATLR